MTKGQPNESSIDITLIVNIHSGTSYLARTMLSIEEAASYADGLGIHCELLFVMDRSPAETLAWAKAYRSDVFATRNMIEVDNGSLGLSRNEGLNAACGEIILFCDEDDLISYNLIAELYSTAKISGSHTVVVPEYFLSLVRASLHIAISAAECIHHFSSFPIIPSLLESVFIAVLSRTLASVMCG